MDAALLSMMQTKGRNKAWVEGMVNLEARKLVNTANTLSSYHLQDGLTRTQFINEIKAVIEQQFKLARMAKTDEECIACIQTLREEAANLREQDRMLRMKTAQLYAKVEFVRENNKIVGYAISAVHVALSGVSVVIGATMMATMNPIGLLVCWLALCLWLMAPMDCQKKRLMFCPMDRRIQKAFWLMRQCIQLNTWDLGQNRV